ncbi:MAG: efflux RND transporter periplasmic adaptor subunit [Bacteroidetes bacterium]|nr:efflux RND transporter periplasmic adaptor subunit [Bacteroidota bacterium]
MKKLLTRFLLFITITALVSCSSKTDTSNDTLTAKKSKLERLKKEQQDLSSQIASLQDEIIKLDPSANPEKAKLVSVEKLSTVDFNHYINLQGRVDAVDISYAMPRGQGGQVKAVYVKQGDYVKKGQLLLKLDDAIIKAQIEQAKTQLNFAKDIYNRRNNLWQENIGTQVDLISAKNNVDQAQHQLDLLNEQLGYTNVYAEMNGVADEVTVKVGEVFPTLGNIKLVNTDNLKVTAQVPENYLDRVMVGGSVKLIFPDINDSISSKISVTGKVVDPNSSTFQIEAKLPSKSSFKPNQLAMVRIMDYSANNTITVPVNTLQTDEQGKYVLVAVNENGKLYAHKKHVVIGEMYNDQLEIKSGLLAGDMLISDGYQNLYDGQLITISAN